MYINSNNNQNSPTTSLKKKGKKPDISIKINSNEYTPIIIENKRFKFYHDLEEKIAKMKMSTEKVNIYINKIYSINN